MSGVPGLFGAWPTGDLAWHTPGPAPALPAEPPHEKRKFKMDLDLKGKKALITGGSRGIGRAIAEMFADEGVDLALCARNEESLNDASAKLQAKGVKVFSKSVDASDGDALRDFVAESAGELGGIDILVWNPSSGPGADEAGWKRSFETDLMGGVRSVEAALPALEASAAASVLFIGTTAAVESFMGATSYGPIKAALISHMSNLSQDLAGKGIRVNMVSPGPVFIEGGSWDMIKKAAPKMYEKTLRGCPQGRMGTAEEVAYAAAFLSSPRASLITGVNLVTDGGVTKRVNF